MRRTTAGLTGELTHELTGKLTGELVGGLKIQRRRKRLLAIIALAWGVCLFAMGLMMAVSVRSSIADELASTLRANLIASEASTRVYFSALIADADRLASEVAIGQVAGDDETLKVDPSSVASSRIESVLAWCVIDASNRVVQSDDSELIGDTLSVPPSTMRTLELRRAAVSTPFALSNRSHGQVMAALSPIHDGGRRVGAAVWLVDPSEHWSKTFSALDWRESGQTFAIDRSARMISRGRSVDQPNATEVMVVAGDPRRRALSVMADQVTRGGTGMDLDGYESDRGRTVIGAWTWVSEYEIGLASEIEVAEAYLPMRRMWRWLFAMAGLMALPLFLPLAIWRADRTQRLGGMVDDAARRIGPYRLGQTLGRGGMGTVYRGTHDLLRRTVAIKVLEGESASTQAVARFEREAQMTAQLRHPNTIDLYDFGRTEHDGFFYVMEYVDGITLEDLVDDFGAQPPARVIHLLLQVCGSLSEAHQAGLIHRDIKPANLMIANHPGAPDMVKVLDFGLVKHLATETLAGANLGTDLTTTAGITGTPMYMSPETVRDAGMSDARSDIYSLGGVGYTLLTGRPIFDGDASADICMKQLKEEPVRPSDRLGRPLPMDLQNVLMSCLRKDADERPRSIDDLAATLRQCQDASGWSEVDALRWWQVLRDDRAREGTLRVVSGGRATKAGGLSTAW